MNSSQMKLRAAASIKLTQIGALLVAHIMAASVLWLLASTSAIASCEGPPALRAALRAKPSAQAYADLGNWFADQKQFECAANSFASAAGQKPDSASYAYLWGLSLSSDGHYEEALAPLQQAAKLDPSDVRPHLALGAVLHRLKRIADAETEWRTALAIDAGNPPALDGLSQDLVDHRDYAGAIALLDKPAGRRERTSLQSLNLGIAFAGTVRLDDAVRVLREGLNTSPDSLPIANELAVVLMLQGRDDEGYAVFELALQKHPDDLPTQLLYLHTLVQSHSEKAPALAHKLLDRYPDNWEVLYLNAVLEIGEGETQQARTRLERSIALNPEYSDSQKALGNVLSQLGDLTGAKAHLERAIALGDNAPEIQYMLAKVLQGLGDSAQARERLQTYQRLNDAQKDKTQAAGKAESGDQAMVAGQFAEAVSLYRDALVSDPDQPLILYKMAKALDKLKDIAGERSELLRAIQLDPNLAEAQNQLGYLAVREGDSGQAETYFRGAVKASPSYVVAWINLAATLASEARWQDAKQALDRALEIDPDNAEARQLGLAIADARPAT